MFLDHRFDDLKEQCRESSDPEEQLWYRFLDGQDLEGPDPSLVPIYLFMKAIRASSSFELLYEVLQEAEERGLVFLQLYVHGVLANRYVWKGLVVEAQQVITKGEELFENASYYPLLEIPRGKLYTEQAQIFRHRGEFEEAKNQITKAIDIRNRHGLRTGNWYYMVRVGIQTEYLWVEDPPDREVLRQEVKDDLDALLELSSGNQDNIFYVVALYQYLKSSTRLRDRMEAAAVIGRLLEDPKQNWIHRLDARQHLAELLAEEYKLYEKPDVLQEALENLAEIEREALQRDSYLFLGKSRIFRGMLKEIEGELEEALEIYNDTLKLALEHNMGMLASQVQGVKEQFTQNMEKMKKLLGENASVQQRMELNRLQRYMSLARELAEEANI